MTQAQAKKKAKREAEARKLQQSNGSSAVEETKDLNQSKKHKQKVQTAKAKQPAAAQNNTTDKSDVSQLDIRVGKIVEVWKHPDSSKLICEKVDIGGGQLRQIASGVQQYFVGEPSDHLQDKLCLVLCNLKAKKLGGFFSHGMVLFANVSDTVELIEPPEGAQPGELVNFTGEERDPPAQLPTKEDKNPWLRV